MPAASLVFFALGPLRQALKLWGVEGVPLTFAIGSVWMGLYLLTIALLFCPAADT